GNLAIGLARAALLQHLVHDILRRRVWTGMGLGGPVEQPRSPFLPESLEPLVGGAHANASGLRGLFHAQALNKDAVHKQGSTTRAQTGMVMQVHPGLLGAGLAS